MAKEWILNSSMNRFQLNFKKNVGPTSESIRQCNPRTLEEWREYYFTKVRSKDHIIELGKKLYIKITEVIASEVENITEQDCIDYMLQLVIDRTFDGYMTEIKTIYGQLERELGYKIEPAPDKWDRLYNVDFFIKINNKFLGLQIKPVNQGVFSYHKFSKRGDCNKRLTRSLNTNSVEKCFIFFLQKTTEKR